MKIFGERLRELRTERKLSLREVGKIVGVSHAAIARYEQNETQPKFETVDKLANFFGVSTDYLFGRTDI
ncbi:MAG: helix-turn-helix domain-containing protein [Firmicutes bacterium]|nr:helix-turn-helix domain-containing protein [Bacillota bacterium]